jgi:type VI protein secretion system component VasF
LNELRTSYLIPAAESQKEGLPVWIFYIIFCAVLLLLFLAFLHNKDLRNKINNIF